MFHVLTLRKLPSHENKRFRSRQVRRRSQQIRSANRRATVTGRSLQRPEPHLSESIARAQCAMKFRIGHRRRSGACKLICLSAFARGYAFAKQLFMRKIRNRERGTERALTGCPVRCAKGAPIPQTPLESSYRKEDSMRNRLFATTAAMLVGMTFAAAQNMPNAQSERGSAGADRQQQGRDMQRGAQDNSSAAQDKRGQAQRSEQRQQRDQTTGQPQAKDRDQNAQGQNKQGDRGNSAQNQNKESQSKQGQSRQGSETQRDHTTGQGQREQSQKNDRNQTQGQAPQRQQGQSDQGKPGQAQQTSPK